MRQFVFAATVVLASAAAAQAGESRSLSNLNAGDPPAATNTLPRSNDVRRADNTTNTTPAAAETPRYAPPPGETQQPSDATRNTSDAPRYTPRPVPVETTRPVVTATTAAPPSDERTYHRSPRYRQAQMHMPMHMYMRPPRVRLTAGRVIAALHRYGIYW